MTNCILCGKKLRQFKSTRDWEDRNTHLKCRPKREQQEQKRLKYFIEQYKDFCSNKNWDYDFNLMKYYDKRT